MRKSIIASLMVSVALSAEAGEKNIVEIAADDKRFSTLVAALSAAGLVDTVKNGEFTVFAPTDDAFAQLPKGTVSDLLKPENKQKLIDILTYHALPGSDGTLANLLSRRSLTTVQGEAVSVRFDDGRIRVNDSTLVMADIKAENGVIHVIDSVLLPPPTGPGNIVETADKAGSFKTLLAAAKAAGLVDALSGEGPLTVFAPTDEAFARVPKKTLDDLLRPENKHKLANILKYHVVAGRVTAGDALNRGALKALNGQSVDISYADGALKAQWATIKMIDVESVNGLIHVIDRVMLPPGKPDVSKTQSAASIIETAIDRGVPAFNHGDHAKCAQIYMNVSKNLVKRNDLSKHLRTLLEKTIKSAA
ncbi:MAG: fasciclin domain-containing protein, partial [Verrucomicrobiota bacterium]